MIATHTLRTFLRRHWSTLLLLLAIVWIWFRPLAWIEEENRPLPHFTSQLLGGGAVSLESLKGQVVLVNVWATWCVWCRKEMPAIEAFWRDHRDKGFTVLALSTDDEAETARRFLAEKGYAFPAAMMGAGEMAAFGPVNRLPTSFIIDADGHLRHRIAGQVHYGRLDSLVTPLLRKK